LFLQITQCIANTTASSQYGCYAFASNLQVDNCILSNKNMAIVASCMSNVYSVTNDAGTGNNYGLFAELGSTIGKGTGQPSATTAESTLTGGVIR